MFRKRGRNDTRRMLRQDLELQNINLAKKFLAEFKNVKSRIDDVEKLSGNGNRMWSAGKPSEPLPLPSNKEGQVTIAKKCQ